MASNAYVTTLNIAPFTTRLISKVFNQQVTDNPLEFTQVFDAEDMKQRVEEETEFVGTGYAGLQPEGRPVNYDGFGAGYTTRFRAFGFGIGTQITREAIRDDLHTQAGRKAGVYLERSMRQTKEWYHAQLFNDTSILGGDGVTILSASHPTLRGGLQSNTLAIQSTLSESAIEELLVQINMARDSSGLKQMLKPVKLIIHPAEEYNANRILRSTQRPGTTDNDINVINAKGIFRNDPVLMRWLTNTRWWGIKTDCMDGLKTKTKDPIEPTSSVDPDTASLKYSVWERYARGCANWRALYGSNPA